MRTRLRELFRHPLQLPAAHESGVLFWRQRILDLILLTAATLGLVAYLPSLLLAIRVHLWSVVLVDSLAYGWAVLALLSPSWSHSTRVKGLLVVFYLVALVLLLRIGTAGSGLLWLGSLPVMAAILLGLGAAVWTWLLALATLAGCGLAMAFGGFHPEVPLVAPGTALASWVVNAVNALFLSAGMALPIAMLLRGLDHTYTALARAEERSTRIFQWSPSPIAITDARGRFLDVNPAWSETFGWPRAEVLGRTGQDLKLWSSRADQTRLGEERHRSGAIATQPLDLTRRDGSPVTVLLSARSFSLDGQPCLLTLCQDLTRQRQAEATLQATAQRLTIATGSAGIGIWEWPLDQPNQVWDERMCAIFGRGPEPVQAGSAWLDQVHPEDRADLEWALEVARNQPGSWTIEYRIILADSQIRHLRSDAHTLEDSQGRPSRMIGMVRDITAHKEAQAERHRLETELQHAQKLESLGQLAGGVAHDMNNILTAILALGSTLQARHHGDPALAKALGTILNAGERGRLLVQRLTDFARKGLDQAQPVDLNELVRREIELLESTTLRKVRLACDLEPDLPAVRGEPSALATALMNLCVNALDAMPEGGLLRFQTRLGEAGQVELAVFDSGEGMSPAVLARAMEPFFTTKPVGKGTGLGLAGVYGTMQAHGGSVELQSQPGAGTCVRLRFPALPRREPSAPAAAAPDPELPSLRVLLVDDDPIIRETLPTMLEYLGHQVSVAACGQDALDRIQAGLPVDLVILDHNMPGLSGAETLQKLKCMRPELAVLMSSGFLESSLEALVKRHPRVWLLNKPYSLRDMKKRMSQITAAARQG